MDITTGKRLYYFGFLNMIALDCCWWVYCGFPVYLSLV